MKIRQRAVHICVWLEARNNPKFLVKLLEEYEPHELWSHLYRAPLQKCQLKEKGPSCLPSCYLPLLWRELTFQPCVARPQRMVAPRGMCPSYAFKAFLTLHGEMHALREVSFSPGIISHLYIIPYNTRIREFGFFLLLHCKRSWEELLFPRQPQKLPMLLTQHPTTFSAHLWMRQYRHQAAWRICCSSNPSIHTSAQTLPTNISHLGWGNGFLRCAATF